MPKKKPTRATPVDAWFASQGWTSQAFQRDVWAEMLVGKSGLLNAPTGTGKTYAVWGGVVNHALNKDVIPGPSWNRAKAKAAIPAHPSTPLRTTHVGAWWRGNRLGWRVAAGSRLGRDPSPAGSG